jgi:hypothetical protein
VKAEVKIPQGWRVLKRNEIVKAGDRRFSDVTKTYTDCKASIGYAASLKTIIRRKPIPERIPMKPLLTLITLILAGCLQDPEPKTITLNCGTLEATDDIDPVPDTFVVVDGKCRPK